METVEIPRGAIVINAENFAFDRKSISVEARSVVTIAFTNLDKAPHNVAFYRNQRANTEFYVGEIITGPRTIIYTFTAPTLPGVYFFRCDVHPGTMQGDFVVTGTAS